MNKIKNNSSLIIIGIILVSAIFIVDRIGITIKEKPRLINTMVEINKTRNLLNELKDLCGKYPQKIISYENLKERIKNKYCAEDQSAETSFKDKWGNLYIYTVESSGYRLMSAGEEWIEGSETKEAEIIKKND